MRKRVGLLTWLLASVLSSGVAAQSPEPTSVRQRIEFPDWGVAITVPSDWEVERIEDEGPVFGLAWFHSLDYSCSLSAARSPLSMDIDAIEQRLRDYGQRYSDEYETQRVQTNAGEAVRLTYELPGPDPDGTVRWTAYQFAIADVGFDFLCALCRRARRPMMTGSRWPRRSRPCPSSMGLTGERAGDHTAWARAAYRTAGACVRVGGVGSVAVDLPGGRFELWFEEASRMAGRGIALAVPEG